MRAKVLRAWADGASVEKIADGFGLEPREVREYLEESGIEP